MNQFNIEVRTITLSEYQTLRSSTSWGSIDDHSVKKALERDLYSVCVLHGKKVIGIGRIVGDGAIYYYIQDIIVLPEYQGQGIGKLIMENIETYLSENTNNNSFIGLMAAEEVIEFYLQFGYEKRPDNRPGMYKMITKTGYNKH